MKTMLLMAAAAGGVGLLAGCQSPPPGAERGPHNTMAYYVDVDASPPGARIEAEGNDAGPTPTRIKIFGDLDGTFHDFGSYTYTVRAYPVASNQYPQVRVYGTGKGFSHEDMIPKKIYFDMNQPPSQYPAYGGAAPYPGYSAYGYYGGPYYGYPWYGYGYPYYLYGPRFYFGGGRFYGPRYYHR